MLPFFPRQLHFFGVLGSVFCQPFQVGLSVLRPVTCKFCFKRLFVFCPVRGICRCSARLASFSPTQGGAALFACFLRGLDGTARCLSCRTVCGVIRLHAGAASVVMFVVGWRRSALPADANRLIASLGWLGYLEISHCVSPTLGSETALALPGAAPFRILALLKPNINQIGREISWCLSSPPNPPPPRLTSLSA